MQFLYVTSSFLACVVPSLVFQITAICLKSKMDVVKHWWLAHVYFKFDTVWFTHFWEDCRKETRNCDVQCKQRI